MGLDMFIFKTEKEITPDMVQKIRRFGFCQI